MERRAELLARTHRREDLAAGELEVAVCTVGNESIGFPVRHLREIVPLPVVTALPFAPECVLGIAQVRGSLLSVIDLGRLNQVKGESRPEHLVVVEAPRGAIGFTVDRVLACRRVSPASLQQGDSGRNERRAALGVTEDLVVVLEIAALLALDELVLE